MPNGSASDLPLLFLCLPSADVVPGAKTLAMLSDQPRVLESAAMAEAELAAGTAGRLVVICPAPEAWIALALATGEAPSCAVQGWRDSVRPLMGLLRARRRQTVLLFDQTFASDPAACAAALGISAPEGPVAQRQSDDPVLVMIAREALRGDPAALTLAEELAATALSPAGTETAGDHDLDVIFDSYVKGLRQQTSAEAGQAQAAARIVALDAEIASLRDALQAAVKAAETSLATERDRAAAAEAKITAQLTAAEAEADLLREQVRLDGMALEQAQAALAAEQGTRQTAEAGQAQAAARIVALDAEIASLRDALQAAVKAAETSLATERDRAAAAEAKITAQLTAAKAEADLLREQVRLDGSVMDQMQAAALAEQDKVATLEAEQVAAKARATSLLQAEHKARAKAEADFGEMIRQLQAQVRQTGRDLEHYHVQVGSLQAERAALKAQIAQLRDARADLEGYYDHAKQFSEQVDVLTTDLGGLQSALQTAQAEAAERAQHAAWLEDEISRIHRSRSYRLTTPLRKLRKTIG